MIIYDTNPVCRQAGSCDNRYVTLALNGGQDSAGRDEFKSIRSLSLKREQAVGYYWKLEPNETHETSLKRFLTAQIAYHGQIEELVIGVHGSSKSMGDSKNGILHIGSALQVIDELQNRLKMGSVVKRLVFAGCNVFTDLSPAEVTALREMSVRLGAEIVGSTARVVDTLYLNKASGEFIKFAPDGSVSWDRLRSTNGRTLMEKINCFFIDGDASWVDFHLGVSKEEGRKRHEMFLVKKERDRIELGVLP